MSVFVWLGTVLTPEDASKWVAAAYPTIGGIIGAAIGFGTIFAVKLFWAPYRQRDEARALVEQQRKPSDSEVIDAIGLLEAETLVLRHNNGEERSYSFAEVFLAIAHRLTVGILEHHFESQILKELDLDARGWFLPYKDEGITHLIGMLVQNALVERRNEEYQHVTREVVSGMWGIYETPDAHLVKNTEVKYYLSQSLGSRVVQRLRQQSVAHTEGSQTG